MEVMDSVRKSDCVIDSKADFAGFINSDAIANIIKKKKQSMILELQKNEVKSLKKNFPLDCPAIVNSNHVNKKKKLVLSSPESIDKNNRNVNKRLKKENLQTETVEPLDISSDQNLELSTPTFNLTSTPRSRRKMNVDITDPIFKLPFELGWKRELVFRTTGEYAAMNRTNRSGDVYYYSPNNRKLRSLREIQEQLDLSISDDNTLTIDSFTFLKQPVGIEDRSKEIIRDANTKLSKEESFASVAAVKPKKSKTPVRPEIDSGLSDNDNNKSSTKMKVVFKNVKKGSRSKSNKDKSTSESMTTSSSTPEYVNEDWKAIQSSVTSIVSPTILDEVSQNSTVDKRRSTEINGSLRETSNSMMCMQSFTYMLKSMRYVFMHLKIHELLSASRVCTAWNIIAMNKTLWQNVRLKNSMVHDWKKLVDTINERGTVSLDTRRMLIPPKSEEFGAFWLSFSNDMKRAIKLKNIELYRCPTHVIEDIIYSLPQLEVLNASSIKNPFLMKDLKNTDYMTLNLKYLNSAKNLSVIRLKGLSGIKLTDISSFKSLTHLRTLSLTSIKSFPRDTYRALESLPLSLECLEIGDCEFLTKEFAVCLERLICLKSLRLENCCGKFDQFSRDIFCAIRKLKNLIILELINIEFSESVEEELGRCCGLRSLLIIPAYISQSATTNCHLIDCLKILSKTLTHLVWGLTHELLRVTELFITQYQQNKHAAGYNVEMKSTNESGQIIGQNIPILKTRKPKNMPEVDSTTDIDISDNVDILSVSALQKLLETMMVCTKTKLIKVPFSGTTRVYLSDHFIDL